MAIEVTHLQLPASADEVSPDGDALRELAELVNRARSRQFGTDAVRVPATEQLALLRDRVESRILCLVARLDGRIVGRATLSLPLMESLTMIEAGWYADPELDLAVTHDVAGAILEAIEKVSRAEARPWILAEVPAAAGDHLAAAGVGSIDADAPEAAALLRAGFTLQQCYRYQLLRLGDESPDESPREDGYRVATWTGAVPTAWRVDFCALASLMQTEVPAADVELDEAVWGEERLAGFEDVLERAGRTLVGAIAWDPEGRPAGYTELMVSASPLARQGDTLVAPEHRGHALGARLKAANLSQLRAEFEHVSMVVTDNAEENRYMLAVNEGLGFVTAAREALFQRR